MMGWAWTTLAPAVCASEEVIWAVPEPVLKVDFAAVGAQTPPRFLDEGAAWELTLPFTLVGREQVTIEAHLPEPGKFEVIQANAAAKVEIRRQPAAGATERIDIVRAWKFKPWQAFCRDAEAVALEALGEQRRQARQELTGMDAKALRAYLRQNNKTKAALPEEDENQLRDLYEKWRAVELGPEVLRSRLEELCRSRGAWVTGDERKAWGKASGFALMRDYGRLLTLDLADKYLTGHGLKRETEQNYASVIALKVEGLEAFASGRSLDPEKVQARQAVRAMTPQDLAKVREALTVLAKCRYHLPADAADPNSQWYHAQRVVCAARNLSSVSVEGTLNPGSHDRADWWTLVDYDPDWVRLEFPRVQGVSHQIYLSEDRIYRLRVAGEGAGALRYRCTMYARTAPPGGKAVVVYESSAKANAKFPF